MQIPEHETEMLRMLKKHEDGLTEVVKILRALTEGSMSTAIALRGLNTRLTDLELKGVRK